MRYQYENREMKLSAIQKKGFTGFPMMYHPHIEILCVLEGSIRVNVDAKERVLGRGEFCAVFPYVLHSYEDSPDAVFRLIMVSPSLLPGLEKLLYEKIPEDPFFILDDVTGLLTEKTVQHMKTDGPVCQQTAFAYVTALMGEIMQGGRMVPSRNPTSDTIKNLLVYCNEHFAEEISVRSAAAACFISESFVSKIFAREIGCSFRSYINALRISYARQLLEQTDKSITGIMNACGFKNQSSFNRVFQNICKETPRQFRKRTGTGSAGQEAPPASL